MTTEFTSYAFPLEADHFYPLLICSAQDDIKVVNNTCKKNWNQDPFSDHGNWSWTYRTHISLTVAPRLFFSTTRCDEKELNK